jgi:hypothetical protein
MFKKFKSALQILIGAALVMQLAGCFYGGDRHYHPFWHHDRGPDVNVNIHG